MKSSVAAILFTVYATTGVNHAADEQQERIKSAVDKAVRPAMEKYSIPGMAVGLIVGGNPYVLNYGVASKETRKPVTPDDSRPYLGTISVSGRAEDATRGELTRNDRQCDAGYRDIATREAPQRRIAKQNWFNQRLRSIYSTRPAEAAGHYHPGQQELSHSCPGEDGLPDICTVPWRKWRTQLKLSLSPANSHARCMSVFISICVASHPF